MTYYALSSTVLNWLTFNKNVNKYAHNRLLLTSSSSQCRYIQCWTGPEQRHSMVLVSTIFFLLPPFSSPLFTVWLNRKLAALDLQKMPSVNDQVAPAHHNHNQSYHPSYSVATENVLTLRLEINGPVTYFGNSVIVFMPGCSK